MNKNENKKLMELAEQVLKDTTWQCPLFKDENRTIIFESYNGQISALGVSILMIGLKPTIAVYYQDVPKKKGDEKKEAFRKYLLEVIARMLRSYKNDADSNIHYANAESLTRYVLGQTDDGLKNDILNCSVALKQIIRTYINRTDNEK